VNPLIRTLSPGGYLASALARAALALLVLLWFWPGRLEPRSRGRSGLGLVIPFFYVKPIRYFGAVVVLIAVPVKALAAWNNLRLLAGMAPPLGPWESLVLGTVAGILFSNALLFWQAKGRGG